MSKKFVFFVSACIFVFSFFLRFAFYSDYFQADSFNSIPLEKLFTSTIGTGSDAEYQIDCAQLVAQGKQSEFMTHYDYLFMCPYMALLLKSFGFINGVQLIELSTIFFGSLVAIVPFLLFSYFKKFSIGGFIASILIAINPLLMISSSGRLVLYNFTTITFTLFYSCYFLAIYKKKPIWLILLGVFGLIEGLNKPFLLLNDIPFLFIFCFLFLMKNFAVKKYLPFILISFDLSVKTILLSMIPFAIMFIGAIGYEFLHSLLVGQPSYLGYTFVVKSAGDLKEQMLGTSLLYKGAFAIKIKNIISLIIVGILKAINFSKYCIPLFIVTLFLSATKAKNPIKHYIISFVSICALSIFLYFITLKILIPNVYISGINDVTFLNIVEFSIFCIFVIRFFFQSPLFTGLVLIQASYLFSLSMTLPATTQSLLFVTLVIWIFLLIAVSIDYAVAPILQEVQKRVYILLISFISILVLIISTPLLIYSFYNLWQAKNEHEYLHWAATQIASNGYILGGARDNLVWVSKDTRRTIIYNALFNARVVNALGTTLEDFSYNERIPQFVKMNVTNDVLKNNIYILDEGVDLWQSCLENGCSETYPKEKYALVPISKNAYLNRNIYKLVLRKN